MLAGAQAVPDRQRVQQTLRRMLVRAIARVHHRNIKMPGHIIRGSRRRMPHHQAVRLHGVQIECGVQQRLAFLDAGSLGLQVHSVGAEPRRGRSKADARARGVLEKRQCHRLSAQRRQFFQWMLLDFLKGFALVKKKIKFVRGERFESEEVAKAVSQCPFSDHKIASPNRQSKNYSTRSTSTTRSSLSISRKRTSMISVALVCTFRPTYWASMGISRWPRSISTARATRFGRPRSKIPSIPARTVRPV